MSHARYIHEKIKPRLLLRAQYKLQLYVQTKQKYLIYFIVYNINPQGISRGKTSLFIYFNKRIKVFDVATRLPPLNCFLTLRRRLMTLSMAISNGDNIDTCGVTSSDIVRTLKSFFLSFVTNMFALMCKTLNNFQKLISFSTLIKIKIHTFL